MAASASSTSAALVPVGDHVIAGVNAPATPPGEDPALVVREEERDVDSVEYWASRIIAMETEIAQHRLRLEMESVFDKGALETRLH